MKLKKIAALLALAGASVPVFATNGMNQAGYGPIAESMGGASMAYDNGTAAAINNPATLGLMASGARRLDVGFGDLRPAASSNGQSSTATDFFMPGFGYARKDGNLGWGVTVMAQGGMGTDYTNGNFWGAAAGFGAGGFLATGQSYRNMSEVGVGRVMVPLAYNVSSNLTIGGSVDYVWAGMDTKWFVDGAHFADLVGARAGGRQLFGQVRGSLIDTMLLPGVGLTGVGFGYFDLEKSGKFRQQATGTGWAGNLGFTYRATPALTIGGVYHAKTNLSDLETDSNAATLTMGITSTATGGAAIVPMTGKIIVRDFQWPETYGIGMAYQASDRLQVVADYKRINWADVMKNLNMTFLPSAVQGNAAAQAFYNFGGTRMDLSYYQNWKNQNVVQLGAAYKYSDALTIRFGANIGDNPIPDQYVSPLFPAVMKDHYMAGFGYTFDKMSSIDAAFVYAPKVSVTNNWSAAGGSNQNISLGTDFSYQVMYSHRF